MQLTHDDRMRHLRATLPETPARAAGVSITRTMLNRASMAHPSHALWRARSAGAMRGLLRLERLLK